MSAAKSLASQGYETHIIEKKSILGGEVTKLFRSAKGEDIQQHLKTLVDEIQDMQFIHEYSGNLSLEVKQARNFKEDAHRLKGKSGGYIIYKVEPPINSWKVYSFFPEDITDFKFYASVDGRDFEQIKFDRKDYFVGKGEYDYYKPVLYNGAGSGKELKYLKIEYTAEAQVSCVEIKYGG